MIFIIPLTVTWLWTLQLTIMFIGDHWNHDYIISLVPLLLTSLKWRHNEHDDVSNHHPHDCLLKPLFRRRSMETSKLRITALCEGNSPVTGEYPAQMASNAENVSIWWRHHELFSNIYSSQKLHIFLSYCFSVYVLMLNYWVSHVFNRVFLMVKL